MCEQPSQQPEQELSSVSKNVSEAEKRCEMRARKWKNFNHLNSNYLLFTF